MTNTANTNDTKKTIISTFNGIGGLTEGLKLSNIPFNTHTICEIDENANKTYYSNNKKTNHANDINELYENIEEGTKVSILVQTPPCQSFSLQGKKKGFESENGNLFLTSIKLQKKINSDYVIYENVKNLVSHNKKTGIYDSLINKDKKVGHTLHTIETLLLEDTRYNYYWKVLNSKTQGLPQNRERIFIVGIKKELDTGFTFPEERPLEFTVEDILEDNPSKDSFYSNKQNYTLINKHKPEKEGELHLYGNYKEQTFESSSRVYYPYISPCITTGNNGKFLIGGKVRSLTKTELKRIHGFREEFILPGNKTCSNRQMGNTVSPGVYKNILLNLFPQSVNNTNYKIKKVS